MPPQIMRNAAPGDAADFGRDLLDHDHQRKTEDEGPRQGEAELRAYLAVGGDAAGVVVRSPGHEARPQSTPQASEQAVRWFVG